MKFHYWLTPPLKNAFGHQLLSPTRKKSSWRPRWQSVFFTIYEN